MLPRAREDEAVEPLVEPMHVADEEVTLEIATSGMFPLSSGNFNTRGNMTTEMTTCRGVDGLDLVAMAVKKRQQRLFDEVKNSTRPPLREKATATQRHSRLEPSDATPPDAVVQGKSSQESIYDAKPWDVPDSPPRRATSSAPSLGRFKNTCILISPLDEASSNTKRRSRKRIHGGPTKPQGLKRKRPKKSVKRSIASTLCSLQRMFAQ